MICGKCRHRIPDEYEKTPCPFCSWRQNVLSIEPEASYAMEDDLDLFWIDLDWDIEDG